MNVFYAAIAKTAGEMLIVYVRTFIGPKPSGTFYTTISTDLNLSCSKTLPAPTTMSMYQAK